MTHQINTPLSEGEDWLITPPISVSTGYELKFWLMPSQPYGATLDIRISTTDTAVASFTDSLEIIDINTLTAIWTEYSYSLNSYVGNNIYIAFKHTESKPLGPETLLQGQQNIDGPVEITGLPSSAIYLDDVTVNAPSSTTTTSIEPATTTVEPTTTTSEPTTTTSVEPTPRSTTTTIDTTVYSVQVYPRPFINMFMELTPNMIPFVMVAAKDSGVEFQQPIEIDWGTPYLDDYARITIGTRFIVGLLYMTPGRLEAGEYKVIVKFGPADTHCAGTILVR